MPVHVEQVTAEVTVLDADFPLTPAQVEKLVLLVMRRIEEKQQQRRQLNDSTAVRRQIISRFEE